MKCLVCFINEPKISKFEMEKNLLDIVDTIRIRKIKFLTFPATESVRIEFQKVVLVD